MSNLRQAAQQAIEAIGTIRKLINMHGEFWLVDALKCHEAADALHKALAEPECMCREPWALGRVHRKKTPCFDYVERKPLTEEEIVRLMVGEDRARLMLAGKKDPEFLRFAEEAIRELVESGRAIERAHGIGERV